ncbi:MAG: hypothetical protein RLY31_3078 [Bacteroidota bacterium]
MSFLLRSSLLFILFGPAFQMAAQTPARQVIRLNQVGFYPSAPKTAIVTEKGTGTFEVVNRHTGETVFSGVVEGPRTSGLSGKETWSADFSALQDTGSFELVLAGRHSSPPFQIREQVHADAAAAALKSYYFQRMSTDLPEAYAGRWRRPVSHPDDRVVVHPSAAGPTRTAGTVISCPGGWYDAGDYNKYIVNSAVTVSTLLNLYEDFPDWFSGYRLAIPEEGNNLPDLLDEILWNLSWMRTMQDPADGGVYHKCTTPEFEGFILPEKAVQTRYVVRKSSQAALCFAATMAQAARVFQAFETERPGLAGQFLLAAQDAWNWAKVKPNVRYNQNQLNERFDPDIKTGTYASRDLTDEKIWAAIELYLTTGDTAYIRSVELFPTEGITLQSWEDVRTMGYLSLLRHRTSLPADTETTLRYLTNLFRAFVDGMSMHRNEQAYLTPMETDAANYVWGSNAVCANQAMAFIYAYRLSQDPDHLYAALDNVDYLLGRNATGYCYLTGFGTLSPRHLHHRPSQTDGIDDPVPGLLVGGPNPFRQDNCPGYLGEHADESYVDDVCSYASNEVAINWNAPLVYALFALDLLMPSETD